MNLAILWRWLLMAWRLLLDSWRLGACSFWPLIMIRGPKRSHPLLMILSSAAIVASCPGAAWLTSIVNFFISSFIVSAGPWTMVQGPVYGLTNLSIGKPSNEIRLHPIISGTHCQACSLLLVACCLKVASLDRVRIDFFLWPCAPCGALSMELWESFVNQVAPYIL